ncbi:MAG: SDR family oxidoreductase [Maribacter sp.]|nr:SDR family oxidoreductase [Maribacter sp.]
MLHNKKCALILGGSRGLGLATAQKLASHGYNLLVIHRDRNTDMGLINEEFDKIREIGVQLKSFNADVANAEKRKELLIELEDLTFSMGKLNVLVHSIAKGNLKPMHSDNERTLDHQDFIITLNAMALSLYDWVKDLKESDLFDKDARIISFTSEGNTKAWPGYAAVSTAKVALEAITRNIALEFAPFGIRANCIQAGTTETAAFAMIPNNEKLKERALERNPNRRLTKPEDVANAVYLLTLEEAKWITGSVIKVDGGESLR